MPDAVEFKHPFFATENWTRVCCNETAGFPRGQSVLEHDEYIGRETEWSLSVRSSIKDYDQEYEAFLNWLFPYVTVDGNSAVFCGYLISERADTLYLIYLSRRGFDYIGIDGWIPFDDFDRTYPLDKAEDVK